MAISQSVLLFSQFHRKANRRNRYIGATETPNQFYRPAPQSLPDRLKIDVIGTKKGCRIGEDPAACNTFRARIVYDGHEPSGP